MIDTAIVDKGEAPELVRKHTFTTDGKTKVGQALARGLVAAGADIVWVGHAEPWKKLPGLDELANDPKVTLVPLDVADSRSVTQLAGEIGGRVDILINNAEVHRTHGISSRSGVGQYSVGVCAQ